MRFALAVAGLALLVSCTGAEEVSGPPAESSSSTIAPSATPSAQPVTDYVSFTQAMGAAGFKVRAGERTQSNLLFREGQTVFIDGVSVSTFEYPTERALHEARSSVGRDGYSVPTSSDGIADVEWVETPHFYSAGKLLVLYLGDERPTLDALDTLLGPQFAGG
ncbi:MAG: hypothetical protein ABI635_05830 [Actinomycetota bacterium]